MMAFSIIAEHCYFECHLRLVSLRLSVTYEFFIPSVIMMSVMAPLQISYNIIPEYKFTSRMFYSRGPVDQFNTK